MSTIALPQNGTFLSWYGTKSFLQARNAQLTSYSSSSNNSTVVDGGMVTTTYETLDALNRAQVAYDTGTYGEQIARSDNTWVSNSGVPKLLQFTFDAASAAFDASPTNWKLIESTVIGQNGQELIWTLPNTDAADTSYIGATAISDTIFHCDYFEVNYKCEEGSDGTSDTDNDCSGNAKFVAQDFFIGAFLPGSYDSFYNICSFYVKNPCGEWQDPNRSSFCQAIDGTYTCVDSFANNEIPPRTNLEGCSYVPDITSSPVSGTVPTIGDSPNNTPTTSPSNVSIVVEVVEPTLSPAKTVSTTPAPLSATTPVSNTVDVPSSSPVVLSQPTTITTSGQPVADEIDTTSAPNTVPSSYARSNPKENISVSLRIISISTIVWLIVSAV